MAPRKPRSPRSAHHRGLPGEVWERDGCIDALMYLTDDWIRDVGPATNDLVRPYRWWSLCRSEEVGNRLALRKAAPKRRPTSKTWWAGHMGTI